MHGHLTNPTDRRGSITSVEAFLRREYRDPEERRAAQERLRESRSRTHVPADSGRRAPDST